MTNHAYRVDSSTNLRDWVLIGPATPVGGGLFEFLDPSLFTGPARYYRAVDNGPAAP
jgi:hypothetical protein